jgi:predicted dehydrogenase
MMDQKHLRKTTGKKKSFRSPFAHAFPVPYPYTQSERNNGMLRFGLRLIFILLVSLFLSTPLFAGETLRLAIVGLVHGHVNGFYNRAIQNDKIDLVGVYDPSDALRDQYQQRWSLQPELLFGDLVSMLKAVKPHAVAVNTSTFDHLSVIETCSKFGVHVMVEKPLAVSMEHARKIAAAAKKGKIHILVNYETTWYPSNHKIHALLKDHTIGDLRKIVVHDGHQGPQEIGCSPEFLDWLTDPERNGAGALFDFGCYGANLITWLMDNQRPTSVTCITQTIKPAIYPRVDDEATLILTYPKTQGIIQASWNWPFNRKDMEVYGKTGFAHADNATDIRIQEENGKPVHLKEESLDPPYNDPLHYLAAVVWGDIQPEGLSSLENNLIVTEILSAARKSAKEGRTVNLK